MRPRADEAIRRSPRRAGRRPAPRTREGAAAPAALRADPARPGSPGGGPRLHRVMPTRSAIRASTSTSIGTATSPAYDRDEITSEVDWTIFVPSLNRWFGLD